LPAEPPFPEGDVGDDPAPQPVAHSNRCDEEQDLKCLAGVRHNIREVSNLFARVYRAARGENTHCARLLKRSL
jgi:hypothetical protein